MAKDKKSRKEKLTEELELPAGTSCTMDNNTMLIKSHKSEVKKQFKQHHVLIKVENNKILLESQRATKKDKKIIGSLKAHIKNMLTGSLNGHTYILKICSGHFPMNVSVSNNRFVVKNFLGEKVPRTLQLKEDTDVKVEGDLVYVSSANKETAGQVSADIEQLTRRPGFDTRIFQDGIHIINKDGKVLK